MLKQADQFRVDSNSFEPAYMELHRDGELWRRSFEATRALESCVVCPRDCEVDRMRDETAVCKSGRFATVSSYFPHFGEEDCLRGWKGSGTIFFSMCNLRCVFCQNHDISHVPNGTETRPMILAKIMLDLQTRGCHNINFVTPEHVVPQIIEALPHAVEMGLKVPLVYNTGAYDSLESLKSMEGVVDIYMPDLKFLDSELSKKYLKAEDYPQAAKEGIKEMFSQVGDLRFDEDGLAKRGVLVRHLVMPGLLNETQKAMQFLVNEVSSHTYVNIMDQYRPSGKVTNNRYNEINRPISKEEYRLAIQFAKETGLYRIDERNPSIQISAESNFEN
jgi:putative pyruvate formate lyase activating enzyme